LWVITTQYLRDRFCRTAGQSSTTPAPKDQRTKNLQNCVERFNLNCNFVTEDVGQLLEKLTLPSHCKTCRLAKIGGGEALLKCFVDYNIIQKDDAKGGNLILSNEDRLVSIFFKVHCNAEGENGDDITTNDNKDTTTMVRICLREYQYTCKFDSVHLLQLVGDLYYRNCNSCSMPDQTWYTPPTYTSAPP